MLTSLLPDVLFIVTVPGTGFMLSADVTVTAPRKKHRPPKRRKLQYPPDRSGCSGGAYAGGRCAVPLDNGYQTRNPAEGHSSADPYRELSGLYLYAAGGCVSRAGGCAGAKPSAGRSPSVPGKFNFLHAHSANAFLRPRGTTGALPMLAHAGASERLSYALLLRVVI